MDSQYTRLICPRCKVEFNASHAQMVSEEINNILCKGCSQPSVEIKLKGEFSKNDLNALRDPLAGAKKAIKAAEDLLKNVDYTNASKLKIEDIYLPLNHLFSVASKQAFKFEKDQLKSVRKVKVIYTTIDKVTDEVRFFGARVTGERNIFDAAKTVATTINELAKDGFITGVLKGCKLMLIELATEPHQLQEWIVVSYVSLSPQGIEALKTRKYPTLVDGAGAMPEAHIK